MSDHLQDAESLALGNGIGDGALGEGEGLLLELGVHLSVGELPELASVLGRRRLRVGAGEGGEVLARPGAGHEGLGLVPGVLVLHQDLLEGHGGGLGEVRLLRLVLGVGVLLGDRDLGLDLALQHLAAHGSSARWSA